MSTFTCEIDVNADKSNKNHLLFEIKGNEEYGLNRTIINAIRRTLLSSIDTYAFRTTYENSDIVIEKMITLFDRKSTTKDDRITLGFAITKALEDSKQFDRVFPYLKSANDGMHSNFPYDVNTDENEINEIIKYFKDFKVNIIVEINLLNNLKINLLSSISPRLDLNVLIGFKSTFFPNSK